MDKSVAAIEFGSKKLKLVIGYELDGQVYVIYAISRPYGLIIEDGTIVDQNKACEVVKETKDFQDPAAQLQIKFSEALLALPPVELEVFQIKQMTAAIGEESKISNIDIRNVYALIRNSGNNSLVNDLIDIVPEYYVLDGGRSFANPPLGESSGTLTISAKVQTLPNRIVNVYSNMLKKGGVNVKRQIVSSYAASQLIASYDDLPEDYILVDIGAMFTSVSLVGRKELYATKQFDWGGDHITEKIIESFNINEADAEKYKLLYGISRREMNFKAPVCTVEDNEGNVIKHYADELNTIIKGELDIFTKQLNQTLVELLREYEQSMKALPMILVGGGAQLKGLVEYLTPKVPSDTVQVVNPRALGARNPTFTNCLGMILANAKNPSVYDDTHPRVGQLTREE